MLKLIDLGKIGTNPILIFSLRKLCLLESSLVICCLLAYNQNIVSREKVESLKISKKLRKRLKIVRKKVT